MQSAEEEHIDSKRRNACNIVSHKIQILFGRVYRHGGDRRLGRGDGVP